MIVFYILLAIIVLMLMVLIHELGHYIVGKKLGFKITEFSIGFGKAIWQKTNAKGEKISLRVLPLGGYCAFYGEEGLEDEKAQVKKDDPDFFTNKHPFKRILVFFGGVAFNFISAIIFSFILLVAFGYGNIYVITDINAEFQAQYQNTGLALVENNDKILKIDGKEISYVWGNTIDNLTEMVEGNTYTLTVQKNETNEIIEIEVIVQTIAQPDEQNNLVDVTAIGITVGISSQPVPFIDALAQCFSFTIGLVWLVLKTLWLLITFQLPLSALGGTLTVISTVATTVQQSF